MRKMDEPALIRRRSGFAAPGLAAALLLSGCIADSGSPLRLGLVKSQAVGDTTGHVGSPRVAALKRDTGFALAWVISHGSRWYDGSVVVAQMDGEGRIVSLRENAPRDSFRYSKPMLSAFPSGGFACVWRMNDTLLSVPQSFYLQVADRAGRTSDPVRLEFPGVYGENIAICALADGGIVATVEGSDSLGWGGLWTRRFARDGTPEGPARVSAYHLENMPARYPTLLGQADGGWLLFYQWSSAKWQRFDRDGNAIGPLRTLPVSQRLMKESAPQWSDWSEYFTAIPLRDGRILVRHNQSTYLNYLVGPDDAPDTTVAFKRIAVQSLLPDVRSDRFFGMREGLVELDSAFRIRRTSRFPDFRGGYDAQLEQNLAGDLLIMVVGSAATPSGQSSELISTALFRPR